MFRVKLEHCSVIQCGLVTILMSLYLCSLPSAEPAEYGVYKPVLIIYGLVDGLQHMLKVRHVTLFPGLLCLQFLHTASNHFLISLCMCLT